MCVWDRGREWLSAASPLNEFLLYFRSARSWLPHFTSGTVHKFLLRWTKVSGIFCWYRDQMSRLTGTDPNTSLFSNDRNNFTQIFDFIFPLEQHGIIAILMDVKPPSFAQMELNFHNYFLYATGGSMWNANYHHICMRLMRDYIRNQKWILHNHIESSLKI